MAKRFSKKFLAVGKIYDTATMTDNEIEASVQKDLDILTDSTGLVKFHLDVREKDLTLRFFRCIDYGYTKPEEEIMDADAYITLWNWIEWLQASGNVVCPVIRLFILFRT